MTTAREIIEAAEIAGASTLPIRWQRGDAQKDYELKDVAPVVKAALLAALAKVEKPTEAMLRAVTHPAQDASVRGQTIVSYRLMVRALRAEIEGLT